MTRATARLRVDERGRKRGKTAREAIQDGSRDTEPRAAGFRGAEPLALAVFAAGLLAALLLVATEFSTVASVEVAGNSCEVISDSEPELAERCELSGFERNGGAFLLLAALAGVMAWGAGIGGSRPAAAALCLIGVLVLAWALLVDLPVTRETGAIGRNFEGASGSAGLGLALELAAGALALGAGVIRLVSADVD